MLADIVPIGFFIFAYFFMALRRFLGLTSLASIAGTIGFSISGFMLEAALRGVLGSSAGYLPALAALYGMTAAMMFTAPVKGPEGASNRRLAVARLLGCAALLFTLSLFLRTIDNAVCREIPVGTHFLWHLLNALVLYLLLRAVIIHFPFPGRFPSPPKEGGA